MQAGLVQDVDEVVNEYDDFYTRVFLPLVVPVLRELGVRETARRTGLAPATVSVALRGASRPRPAHLKQYLAIAATQAREKLSKPAGDPIEHPASLLRRYLELNGGEA